MTYACKDRPPFEQSIKVADGWESSWARRMVDMEFRMDPSCVYSTSELGQADEKCHGCRWKAPANGTGAPTEVGTGLHSLPGVREVEGEPSSDQGPSDMERVAATAEQRRHLRETWPTAQLYEPIKE